MSDDEAYVEDLFYDIEYLLRCGDLDEDQLAADGLPREWSRDEMGRLRRPQQNEIWRRGLDLVRVDRSGLTGDRQFSVRSVVLAEDDVIETEVMRNARFLFEHDYMAVNAIEYLRSRGTLPEPDRWLDFPEARFRPRGAKRWRVWLPIDIDVKKNDELRVMQANGRVRHVRIKNRDVDTNATTRQSWTFVNVDRDAPDQEAYSLIQSSSTP